MKAAVLQALHAPLAVLEVPEPPLGEDEVLVRTHSCGICRTDLHIQDGLAYVPRLPHIPGHEPAGTVAAVGSRVAGITPGQRVVPHLFIVGKPCFHSRAQQPQLAQHLDGIIGVSRPGGFADYFTAPAANLLPLPDAVPFGVAGLASCSVITAVHAWHRAGLTSGDAAAVIGVGGIGVLLLQLLRHHGIRATALVRDASEIPYARAHGAEVACATDDPRAGSLLRDAGSPGRDGLDCVFETVGRSTTMAAAAAVLRRDGLILVIGEEAEHPAIDTIAIAQRELRIAGSRNGSLADAAEALRLMAAGVLRPPVHARFPLSDINHALDLARAGQVHGRILIDLDPTAEAGGLRQP